MSTDSLGSESILRPEVQFVPAKGNGGFRPCPRHEPLCAHYPAPVPLSASYDGDSSAATSIVSGVARRPVTCSMLIR